MFSKFLSITVTLLMVTGIANAQAKERVYGGVGFAGSATTTPTEFVFEQGVGDNAVLTGDFASDTNWVKGTNWAIAGGDATCAQAAASTSSLSQASLDLTDQAEYRLTYTVSELGGTAATITPSLGNDSLTARTADGTYTEDFTMAGTDTLAFQFSATSAATGTIDNVYVYEKPAAGWVDFLDISTTSGAATVYIQFNGDATDFANQYSAGRCMQVEAGGLVLDLVGQKTPVYKMYYRVATGTESFIINAR